MKRRTLLQVLGASPVAALVPSVTASPYVKTVSAEVERFEGVRRVVRGNRLYIMGEKTTEVWSYPDLHRLNTLLSETSKDFREI